jgi:hypothetical protein
VLISRDFVGIYLGICVLSIYALFTNTNTTRFWRNFYISFSAVNLLLNTLYFVGPLVLGLQMWITARSYYPGANGPLEYYLVNYGPTPLMLLGNATQNLAIALNDGLMARYLAWLME